MRESPETAAVCPPTVPTTHIDVSVDPDFEIAARESKRDEIDVQLCGWSFDGLGR